MEKDDKSDVKGDDRSVHINGPVTNSPLSTGEFHGPVTYSYSGTTEVNVADSITINKEYIQRMPQEYAASFEQLTEKINEELKKEKVPPEKVDPLQESANDLAKELSDVKKPESVPFEKKHNITEKFIKFGKAIARASPTIARIVIGMTPLAPIGELVGRGFDKIVEESMKQELI
jgi:hypothetical protein